MDARGDTPRVWRDEIDLTELVSSPGPFVTVHLSTPAVTENAAITNENRWRSVRDRLLSDGAPDTALKGIDDLIPDAHLHGEALFVVATADGVRHVSYWPRPASKEFAGHAHLPSLSPLMTLRQSMVPHVRATVDRMGCDISAFEHVGNALHTTRQAEDAEFVQKVRAGGWSARRYEQRVENTWEQHARDAADNIASLAERVQAEIIFLAGDVRAVQLTQTHLPERLSRVVQIIDGSRSEDGGPLIDEAQVEEALSKHVAQQTSLLLDKFTEEQGQSDRAVEGDEAVFTALAMGQVEALLVFDDMDDERVAWFGPEPAHLALEETDLKSLGVDKPLPARLVDVAIHSALATNAGVRVLPDPDGISESIAALLRWT